MTLFPWPYPGKQPTYVHHYIMNGYRLLRVW